MDPRVDEIIEVWFGPGPVPSQKIYMQWFAREPVFDAQLKNRFGNVYGDAVAGRLEAWRGAARSELALIILLDQFSRNFFRDDPRAFATDATALALTRELRASGRIHELTPHQQMFALMPYQHTEDRAVQAEGIGAFTQLLEEARTSGDHDVISAFENTLEFAKRHQEIIERFGRFPHRNKVLGRESTPQELAFLQEPNSSF